MLESLALFLSARLMIVVVFKAQGKVSYNALPCANHALLNMQGPCAVEGCVPGLKDHRGGMQETCHSLCAGHTMDYRTATACLRVGVGVRQQCIGSRPVAAVSGRLFEGLPSPSSPFTFLLHLSIVLQWVPLPTAFAVQWVFLLLISLIRRVFSPMTRR